MKHIRILLMSMAAALLVSCGTTSTVPITGRKQNLMVSDQQILSLSNQQYTEYMKTAKPSTNKKNTEMVKRVGQKLATAVTNYLNNNGLSSEVANFQWEFNLVQDNQVNAFCMPGGKIVVYEGILPVTQDETSLAIVLGHEIAHAVAKHSAEQMSTAIRQQYGAQALSVVLSGAGASSGMQNIAGTVFGLGAKGASAKYSRNHESEADHLGIIFAAMAGYNPDAAVAFWQRMSAHTGGGSTSWLSTHPSDATRIKQIQGWLPEARKYYNGGSSFNTKTTKNSTKSSTMKTIHIKSK
ncbi:MAG: M48 family metallopeptidase [Bacteroidaceae bacterium]|nr:M48 family metallopeptidase [Bacteroidaceae bacterium]